MTTSYAFTKLFLEAYTKCFGTNLVEPLTEKEAKRFSAIVFEKTGLLIGSRSLKNYSIVVLGTKETAKANPNPATLDILARYVGNAPKTSDLKRNDDFSYWYVYLEEVVISKAQLDNASLRKPKLRTSFILFCGLLTLSLVLVYFFPFSQPDPFNDDFINTSDSSLLAKGWMFGQLDLGYWSQKGQNNDHLTLFTLTGDQWVSQGEEPMVLNSLWKNLESDCYEITVYFSGFIPSQNWQQAGLFLAEEQSYQTNALRVSLAYSGPDKDYPLEMHWYERKFQTIVFNKNDTLPGGNLIPYRGGVKRITHEEKERSTESLEKTLAYTAVRIQRNQNVYRVYGAFGPNESSPFNLIYEEKLDFDLNIVELFAHRSYREIPPEFRPVKVDRFTINYCDP